MRFATVVALAAGAAAAPLERRAQPAVLPLTQVSNVNSLKAIVEKGQARLRQINGKSAVSGGLSIDQSSGSVTNEDVTYVAPVTIGGKTWSLIVDTGSSNTWCGAHTKCEPTSSGVNTHDIVEVEYGSGIFKGTEYYDSTGFGGLVVKNQSIGSASSAEGFSGVDGIIGFGPVALTKNTVFTGKNKNKKSVGTVPTFMNNLLSQGSISQEVLGVYFTAEPGSSNDTTNGELTLGGIDTSKFTGSLTYFPTATSGPNSRYWGADVSGYKYGSTTIGQSANAIVDTGTTLIYIPSAAYTQFLKATGGKTDTSSGLAVFSTAPTETFEIEINNVAYPLTPEQYLIPKAQYSEFGLKSGKYYAWINSGGSSGVDAIIGQKFIENYYSVFDTTNSRIGFAAHS